MKLIEVQTYEEMSEFVADRLINRIRSNSPVNLGLATGGTPLKVYEKLVIDHKINHTSYQNVATVNLDEYIGLSPDHPNSYHYYMNEQLFYHIDIRRENIHIPNGMAKDLEYETTRYEMEIKKLGGIDTQLLGIGENGHIGFNEPGTSFEKKTHVIPLTKSTFNANARYFYHYEEVPTYAITMGIKSILSSKEIILMASGVNKAEAIYQLFNEEISETCPATVLRTHSNVWIVADKEARSLLQCSSIFQR